ncbi:MAG: winged helix-turn-helix domain-containing protein [Polyangiaceae bacterium]|nr:winged helix-turn-helix domain-containing protein [Polyangiaceae bacterium]
MADAARAAGPTRLRSSRRPPIRGWPTRRGRREDPGGSRRGASATPYGLRRRVCRRAAATIPGERRSWLRGEEPPPRALPPRHHDGARQPRAASPGGRDVTEVPAFHTFMSPCSRCCVRALPSLDRGGRSSDPGEAHTPAEVLAIPHGERGTEVEYRIAWARTWLKKAGLVTNPSRGKWTVTEQGRSAGPVDPGALVAEVSQAYRASRSGDAAPDCAPGEETDEPELEPDGELEEEESSTGRVGPVLSKRLTAAYEKLGTEGALLTREQVSSMLARFRERFGPEALAGLDGVALLTRLHARGNKDSLVHWLEFKEDEELTTSTFGSIAGGAR